MRCAGRVALMRRKKNVCRIWWGKVKERFNLKDVGIGGRIILIELKAIEWECVD
jgi:hypothetical protein